MPSRCDLNDDFRIDKDDVELMINMALEILPCIPEAQLSQHGRCTVVDVQLIVNAAIGRNACMSGK